MNSPGRNESPKYKNLKIKHKQSPIELKEKMRKNYKNKVQNCRNMLLNRFRGTNNDEDLHNTLSDIYKNMFNFSDVDVTDDEEIEVLEEIKKELIQEELQWLMEEYEKSNADNIDWATVEEDNSIICPICQKSNCKLQNNKLSCLQCNYSIKTQKSLTEIKQDIFEAIEKHSDVCDKECQFTLVSELNDMHVYLICYACAEMQITI